MRGVYDPGKAGSTAAARCVMAARGAGHDQCAAAAYGFRVEYVRYRPGPPLDAFVDYLWSLSDAPPHAKERIMPSGTLELVINLAQDEIRVYGTVEAALPECHPGCVVSGAFDRPFVVDTREHASLVGVHFRQGGAAPFVSAPADQLASAHIALADLWPPGDVVRLRERLCAARTNQARFQLLENALRARVRRAPQPHKLVGAALDHMRPALTSVGDVVAQLGVSHRHFIELFGQEVGLTPKTYLRVQRFQRVLALMTQSPAPPWSRVAQLCGYFDQAHLIRDFHAFAGLTPTQYVDQRSEHVKDNHVPLVPEGSNLSNTGTTSELRLHGDGQRTRARS
jgi:AraC-like DNA-binding protein